MTDQPSNKTTTVKLLRVLYVVWVFLGIFSIMYVPSSLIELADPIKTAENIAANTTLFRLGIAGRLVTQLLFILIPFLLFQLFHVLDKTMASLMLISALVSIPISMKNEALNFVVLENLQNPELMMESIHHYGQSMNISLLFWGLWLLPLGWLVFKYGLFPKFVGVSLFIGGTGYLIDAFLNIIIPDFKILDPVFEIMTFGEMVFILWLVFVGIRKAKGVSPSPK